MKRGFVVIEIVPKFKPEVPRCDEWGWLLSFHRIHVLQKAKSYRNWKPRDRLLTQVTFSVFSQPWRLKGLSNHTMKLARGEIRRNMLAVFQNLVPVISVTHYYFELCYYIILARWCRSVMWSRITDIKFRKLKSYWCTAVFIFVWYTWLSIFVCHKALCLWRVSFVNGLGARCCLC